MDQMNLFEVIYEPLPRWKKPVVMVELFGGIGAQLKAIKKLDLELKEHHLVEVDIDATISYAAIHCNLNEVIKTYEFPNTEEMLDYLTPFAWMTNDKPKDISRLKVKKLKRLYLAQKLSNNLGNIFNLTDLPQADIISWSTPCQDFSIAGKRRGFDGIKGSLTTVTLDLFEKLKEKNKLPTFLLFENVKAIMDKDNIRGFNIMRDRLNQLGYENITLIDMNSKKYGIPQNRPRVFIVSIRKDYIENKRYDEPKPIPLELKLKDMLQDNPAGKYNLSLLAKQRIARHGNKIIEELETPKVASTIHAGYWKGGGRDQQYVIDKSELTDTEKQMITEDGNIKRYIGSDVVDEFEIGDCADISFPKGYNKGNRVFKEHAPALTPTTMKCLVVKVDDSYNLDSDHYKGTNKQVKMNELLESGLVKVGDVVNHSYTSKSRDGKKQRELEEYIETKDGIAPCVTTRADIFGVVIPTDESYYLNQDQIKKMNKWKSQQNPLENVMGTESIVSTITARGAGENHSGMKILSTELENTTNIRNNPKALESLRIRKLTELECFRLMGFDDEDYFNASEQTSGTQLYKQAGNSIVVNVLVHIMKNMFMVPEKKEGDLE